MTKSKDKEISIIELLNKNGESKQHFDLGITIKLL